MADILFPVGRMIGGSFYKAQPKLDNFGKPKHKADGTPETSFSFGVAIPKTQAAWQNEPWGAQVKAVGEAAYPGMTGNPSFAWKIIDGDSTIPNKKNRRPCDQEGYRGNWVLWFSQGWCPKLVNANGTVELSEPDAVVPGYFIQVFGSVKGNSPSPTPGVYLNPIAVALAGYGERIESSGVDTTAVGFGGALPPGASSVPVGMSAPAPAMTPPAAPAHSVPPTTPGAPYAAHAVPPVTPNAAFLTPPPPPAAPVRQMTAAAGGVTYEAYVAQGWTDALLVANGLMIG